MKLVTKYVGEKVATKPQSVNRIVIVDCSGSMYSDLPKLRKSLKNKLPTLVRPEDSLTLIWFSGRGQCGTIFEDIEINTGSDLATVNAAIDRFLVPQGATAFADPLELTLEVIDRSSKDQNTIVFMSDGGNNDSSVSKVFAACDALADKVAAATFVEFGYYADHDMLMKMADTMSGNVVLSSDYNKFVETLSDSMMGAYGKKMSVDVPTNSNDKYNFVVGSADMTVVGVPKGGKVSMPSNTTMVSYFVGSGPIESVDDVVAASAVVGALIQRGLIEDAMDLAAMIGDRDIYKSIENAFSKQDYDRAVRLSNDFGSGKRALYANGGKQSNLAPDVNAYNILTLLMDLASEDGNYIHISHPDFQYSSIGAKRETADVDGFVPKFTDKAGEVMGAISALKFDEDRPNVSILVKRDGSVSLPENEYGFGNEFNTFVWRNYTIIRDGIVNLPKLPVVLSKASYDLMVQNGVIDKSEKFVVGKTYVIDTTLYPVINRSMAVPVTLTELFQDAFTLYTLEAEQKVVQSRIEKPAAGEKFSALYGEEGAVFLKSFGITEGGFSPKTVKGDTIDPYTAKVIELKLAGLSSIPKIVDVETAIATNKKLTPSQQVVANVLSSNKEQKEIRTLVREAREALVMKKFGIILGKKLPTDMVNLEDTTREMDFGLGKQIKCQFIMADKEV